MQVNRDLARTRPVCLLERQFPKNLLFGQAKISRKIFQFWPLGCNHQIFSYQTIFYYIAEVYIALFDTLGY